MSLTEEFFKQRQTELERYHDKGYQELSEFLQDNDITEVQLIDAGLLEGKTGLTTADLLEYQVSKKGKPFFKELIKEQLILINDEGKQQLLDIGIIRKK